MLNTNGHSDSGRQSGIISLAAWLRSIGRSDTTGWRWAKAGWIHPINIAGRPYLTGEDIAQFEERAKRGELARAFSGAAQRSAEARKTKELVTTSN